MIDNNPARVSDMSYVPSHDELEACKPIYREAGRAVVARLLNFEVAWVSLDTAAVRRDPSAFAEGFASGHRNRMTNFDVYISPIIKKKGVLSKDDKKTVTAYCSLVMTGPFCEWRANSDSHDHTSTAAAFQKVNMILRLVEPNWAARSVLFDSAGNQLNKLISENGQVILEVGKSLFERTTLTGEEIDDLIKSGLACAA